MLKVLFLVGIRSVLFSNATLTVSATSPCVSEKTHIITQYHQHPPTITAMTSTAATIKSPPSSNTFTLPLIISITTALLFYVNSTAVHAMKEKEKPNRASANMIPLHHTHKTSLQSSPLQTTIVECFGYFKLKFNSLYNKMVIQRHPPHKETENSRNFSLK